jgi:hypothetical protein
MGWRTGELFLEPERCSQKRSSVAIGGPYNAVNFNVRRESHWQHRRSFGAGKRLDPIHSPLPQGNSPAQKNSILCMNGSFSPLSTGSRNGARTCMVVVSSSNGPSSTALSGYSNQIVKETDALDGNAAGLRFRDCVCTRQVQCRCRCIIQDQRATV